MNIAILVIVVVQSKAIIYYRINTPLTCTYWNKADMSIIHVAQ